MAQVPETTLPRTQYYMNVDHMDGFPLVRGTYMTDSSGALAAKNLKTFRDTNTIILSGDIHASFVTDHGAGSSGRCIEFTTTAVSSGTFGTFVGTAIAGLLQTNDPQTIGMFTSNLPTFLQEGVAAQKLSPQQILHADTTRHGVSIMELTADRLTNTFYLLNTAQDETLLTVSAYNSTATLEPHWEAVTYVINRDGKANSAPVRS
jgi:phosphodiesterase/alkaline phosphatase D-like protein